MTKLSQKPLDPENFGQYVNNLWSAFTLLGTKQDIRLLFKDLFTHTEYKMFAKRLEIARLLLKGDSYQNIQKTLSVTSHTIGRVGNILSDKGDGLRKAHEALTKMEEKHLAMQKERTTNLETPFRQKTKRKTVLGALLKAGLVMADKKITKTIKDNSAQHELPL